MLQKRKNISIAGLYVCPNSIFWVTGALYCACFPNDKAAQIAVQTVQEYLEETPDSREEREQIVAESLGYMEANCDGCSSGLAEMYQAYIDGEKELRDINMEFHAGYVSGEEVPGRRSCPM